MNGRRCMIVHARARSNRRCREHFMCRSTEQFCEQNVCYSNAMNGESTESIHCCKFLHENRFWAAKRFIMPLFTSLGGDQSRIVKVFSIAN
jgi:hypothetical protein